MIDLEKVNFVQFSGGEIHLNSDDFFNAIQHDYGYRCIWSPIRNSNDLMKLIIFTDALHRATKEKYPVIIPYLPYARQDRVSNIGESLSIKKFCEIINLQEYPRVYIMDPHSDVCTALLDNVSIMHHIDDNYLASLVDSYDDCVVLAPDAGAYKRLCKNIKEVPLIYATKQRDTKTGALSNLEIHTGNIEITGKKILVVDDICDGGGTFNLLADEFGKKYNNELNLYVTHGIFSKGYDELKKRYKQIYTTNSFYNDTQSFITVRDLKQLVE